MIYYVECIPAGTWLLQQLYSKFPLDQLELGCLFDGLNAFLRQPTLGGRSSAGYGQVRIQLRGTVDTESVEWPAEWSKPIRNAVNAYQNYLTEKQGEILRALTVKTEEIAQ
jgi:CRISPR/Cas system CSM-associated protein Csm3 (group 7 of RAMP superfamily)